MKKIILYTSILMLFSVTGIVNVSAQPSNNFNTKKEVSISTEVQDDGYTIETIIEEDINKSRSSIKSGTKTVNYKNGSTILWSVSVKGTFSYNGSSAIATGSTITTSSKNNYWKISNQKSSRINNKAVASAVGNRYTAGIIVQTIYREVTLSCTKTGNLY